MHDRCARTTARVSPHSDSPMSDTRIDAPCMCRPPKFTLLFRADPITNIVLFYKKPLKTSTCDYTWSHRTRKLAVRAAAAAHLVRKHEAAGGGGGGGKRGRRRRVRPRPAELGEAGGCRAQPWRSRRCVGRSLRARTRSTSPPPRKVSGAALAGGLVSCSANEASATSPWPPLPACTRGAQVRWDLRALLVLPLL